MNKYETIEINTENLVIKKGTSQDCIKIYEYDMLKCRDIANEDIVVKSDKKIDFIGDNTDEYYNCYCNEAKMYDWYVYLQPDIIPIANISADREIDYIKAKELAVKSIEFDIKNGAEAPRHLYIRDTLQ